MSITITTAQVQQYRRNIELLHQQMGSKLREAVRVEPTMAKFHYFDLLAPTSMVKNTARHADTPLVNSQHKRRRAEMFDYDWADLIDQQDRVRLLVEPEGAYVQNAAMALGRSFDEEVIASFDRAAAEGETGATTVAFDSATFEIGGAGIPMSVDLLRTTKKILDEQDVPDDDRHIVIAPQQLQDLLAETEFTSSDFASVKALVMGDVDTFLGFKFHRVTPSLLPYNSGTDIRTCFAWHKNSMGMATGKELTVDVGPRRDKRNSTQVYVCAVFGGVRIQDAVVRILCDESP